MKNDESGSAGVPVATLREGLGKDVPVASGEAPARVMCWLIVVGSLPAILVAAPTTGGFTPRDAAQIVLASAIGILALVGALMDDLA